MCKNPSFSQRWKLPHDVVTAWTMRLLFLIFYASQGCLQPYLPVYYKSLGHGSEIIGLLSAVKPATTFVVAPAWGMISDAVRKPFAILQLTFVLSLVGQVLVCCSNNARTIMVLVFAQSIFSAPVKGLLDSMVLEHMKDRSLYGRVRLWGSIGFGVGAAIGGSLVSYSRPHSVSFDFFDKLPVSLKPALLYVDASLQSMRGCKLLFGLHALLSIPAWLCILSLQQVDRQKQCAQKKEIAKGSDGGIVSGLLLLVHDTDVLLFFFLVFVVGASSGVLENFVYVRMREVGATATAMGVSRFVSALGAVPSFWFSGHLTASLGADKVIALSLLVFTVRFVLYAYMRTAIEGLPAEALRGITFAAFWSTATVYVHRVSPPGMHATMRMILSAMYAGLGQSLGAIVGGKLQHLYGGVPTFMMMAVVDFLFAILVLVLVNFKTSSQNNSLKSCAHSQPMEAQKSK